MWISARAATIGDVVYERLAPVLVIVLDTAELAGATWLHAVPFGIDELDARADEIVLDPSDSTLGLATRIEINQELRLHPSQLERRVGQIGAEALEDLHAGLAGDPVARRRGTAAIEPGASDGRSGRPDLAVLMVLQEPWWKATDRGPR